MLYDHKFEYYPFFTLFYRLSCDIFIFWCIYILINWIIFNTILLPFWVFPHPWNAISRQPLTLHISSSDRHHHKTFSFQLFKSQYVMTLTIPCNKLRPLHYSGCLLRVTIHHWMGISMAYPLPQQKQISAPKRMGDCSQFFFGSNKGKWGRRDSHDELKSNWFSPNWVTSKYFSFFEIFSFSYTDLHVVNLTRS